MKWTSFSILVAFLIFTNSLVRADVVPTLPATPDLSQYSGLPSGVTDLLNQVRPDQFAHLPASAQQQLAYQRDQAITAAREKAAALSPVANGQIPTLPGVSTLPSLPSSASSLVPGNNSTLPIPGSSLPASSSFPAANPAPSTTNPSAARIDPLAAINSAMTMSNTIAQQSDYSSQDIAVKAGIHEWTSYYGSTAEKLDEVKAKYQQLKEAFTDIKQELQSMAAKMPILIPNCTTL